MKKMFLNINNLNSRNSWWNKINFQVRKVKSLILLCLTAAMGIATPSWAIEADYAVFGDGDGVIYSIHTDGSLSWFQHSGRLNGVASWANAGKAVNVGQGWANPIKVFSGGDGIIYAITSDGKLGWYRHDGRYTGTSLWAKNIFTQIGTGWHTFTHVFSAGNGIIYAITTDNRMLFRRKWSYIWRSQ